MCACVCGAYHSWRRHLPDENALITDALARRLDHCNAEQLRAVFDNATSDQQSEIIRRKLRALQRRLDPEDYASLAHLFRDNLRLATDHQSPSANDSATPTRRAAQSAVDACRGRMETLARRVMFSTVLGMESRLEEIVARRRAYVAQQAMLQYHVLLNGLIHHGAADFEAFHHDDDEDCFSTRLDQLLRDLADIDSCLNNVDGDLDLDRDAVMTLAAELSLGWWSGTTTLCVAGQRTVVPNVTDVCYQKLLLYDAAVSPYVRQLSVYDVDELLDNIKTSSGVEQPLPAVWSVPDVILAETAGHVYRLLHGLEKCCSLDSPSCVLTGLIVYDRLCWLRQHGGQSTQQGAGRHKIVENHGDGQTAADGTPKTVEEDEQCQSASKKTKPADSSNPESD